jgi:hypothetical protein
MSIKFTFLNCLHSLLIVTSVSFSALFATEPSLRSCLWGMFNMTVISLLFLSVYALICFISCYIMNTNQDHLKSLSLSDVRSFTAFSHFAESCSLLYFTITYNCAVVHLSRQHFIQVWTCSSSFFNFETILMMSEYACRVNMEHTTMQDKAMMFWCKLPLFLWNLKCHKNLVHILRCLFMRAMPWIESSNCQWIKVL